MRPVIGTFEDIVALAPAHAVLLVGLRALAFELHPGLVEVARPGERSLSWGWGARKMREAYAYALPYTRHVNLGFYRGAFLPDPAGRLKGTGVALRHVTVKGVDDLSDPAIRDLMAAAREERRVALGLAPA